jgi:hypothetical protein
MLRLNTAIAPVPFAQQNRLGVVGNILAGGSDNAGFPNGRRPKDDVVDIALVAVMGGLCMANGDGNTLGLGTACKPSAVPLGAHGVSSCTTRSTRPWCRCCRLPVPEHAAAGQPLRLPERQTTLSPRQQAAYLEEIRAAPALRAQARAWAEAGLPWQERYRKHARIELGGGAGVPQALPLGLDFVPEAGPWRAGGRVEVRLLRDGQALAGQPVQLRGSQAAAGFWLRTDADGRIVVPLPLAGPWMLRTVHLEPEAARPGHWLSRFATLVLEVEP